MNIVRSSINRRLRATAELIALGIVLFVFWQSTAVDAAPRIGPVPTGCVEQTPFVVGETDHADDYRCAGSAIQFHTAGVGRSPGLIWAGQWLFVDEAGRYRKGSCTFNRGIHPSIDRASVPTEQSFPMDPSGRRGAYLTWRYGDTTDVLTATAMWAVMHFYAQDAAGSNRAGSANAPLVPSLQMLSDASGRQDVEDLAIVLDAEAKRLSGPFAIGLNLRADGSGRGHGVARVASGDEPVASEMVMLTIDGATFTDGSRSLGVSTDGTGAAAFEFVQPTGDVTVVATARGPADAEVYVGAAAEPVDHRPQTLVAAGPSVLLSASASITVQQPSTTTTVEPSTTTTTTTAPTTTAPTTTAPTTTVEPSTTMTVAATTTTDAPAPTGVSTSTTAVVVSETQVVTATTGVSPTTTTAPETTAVSTSEISATVVPTTVPAVLPNDVNLDEPANTNLPTAPETTPEITPEITPKTTQDTTPLPQTGSDNQIAYLGTSLLVAGVGVVGAIRRRVQTGPVGDASLDASSDADGFW